MNWLFIHQNFPGQYVHAARYLADAGHRVVAIGQTGSSQLDGVTRIEYSVPATHSGAHEFVREFDASVRNALAVAGECEKLKQQGFVPDLVIGHTGWGETIFVKDVWPSVPVLGYFEFYYRPAGSDIDFDPEFAPGDDTPKRLRTRNSVNLLALEAADRGQTPTRWQLEQYPTRHRQRISVLHEGIDTDIVKPNPTAKVWLRGGVSFSSDHEVVTYSTRNLEPYRGFHVFMRALPKVLQSRPNVQVLIVGGDGVSYGAWPKNAPSWRLQLLDELDWRLDLKRVHFLGRIPFHQYLAVLQLSSAHVYFTYPFVLSWSLIEALSAGCHVIASRTAPVEEVVRDGVNGTLVDFFDVDALAERIVEAVQAKERFRLLRAAARETIVDKYDLRSVCLPAHLALWEELTGRQLLPRALGARDRRASARAEQGSSADISPK